MTDPPSHRRIRKPLRLPGHDYRAAGVYLVTVCTAARAAILGRVEDGVVRPSELGKVVEEEWRRTGDVRTGIEVDALVVMPNHFHGILILSGAELPEARAVGRGPPAGSVGAVIGQIKAAASRRINAIRGTPGAGVWQRGFHDRVLRTEREMERARAYIRDNPVRWHLDRHHEDGLTRPQFP